MLLSEMPSFLTEELGFSLQSAGILCVAPYAGMFVVTILGGKIFDYLQTNYYWKPRTIRQVAQFIAFGGSGTFLLICGFMNNKYMAYVFICFGQAILGMSQCGLSCVFLEVSPKFSSVMNTIGNTIGALAGILGPIIVAQFTSKYNGIWGWRYVFILTDLMCIVSLILWRIYQTSDVIDVLNTPIDE